MKCPATEFEYDGSERWSQENIQRRYDELARRFHVAEALDLRPAEPRTNDAIGFHDVIGCVIAGIEQGDPACIELGVEFIQEDQRFPFGRVLKSNTARALRRAVLTEYQRERIRKRVMEMLVAGHVPREYRQYARLARKVGLGKWWDLLAGKANLGNQYVRRFFDYFQRYAVR